MKIQWTAKAVEDLDRIYKYYALRSEDEAKRLCYDILKDSGILSSSPTIGNPLPQLSVTGKDFHYIFVARGNYKMVYYTEGDKVYVSMLWDNQKDYSI